MSPQEVLAELDSLGITVWWWQVSDQQEPRTYLNTNKHVPPELRAAIDQHTGTLLKTMKKETGAAPGIYHRKPRRPRGAV